MNTTEHHSSSYYLLILFIIISGMACGYNVSVIASSLPQIKRVFIVTDNTLSILAGLVFAGTACAKLMISVFNDNFGRRRTMLIAIIIFMIGTGSIILANTIQYIIIGRVLQGFGGGLLMFTASLYVIEISNDNSRGRLTALYQLSFTIGLLIANIIGMAIFNVNWKLAYVFLLILLSLTTIIIYILPCSPQWLFRHGNISETIRALKVNHSNAQINARLASWNSTSKLFAPANVFQAKYLFALCLIVIIAALNQLTGINAILQTSTVLITQAGFSNHAALLSSISITSINVIGTIIGIYIIDKFPRNLLLGYCGIIIAIAHTIISLNYFTGLNSGWLLLGGLMLFIVTFAIGPGIIIWLVFAEYLPVAVRSQGIALAGFVNALTGFFVSALFLYLNKQYGTQWVFGLCAAFSLIYGLIPIFYLPDTNGKDIEDFDKLFNIEPK